MPSEASDEMVAFRLAPRDRQAIQRLVDTGEFRNRSDFFRYAVKAALESYGVPKPSLDLDLEGVELPTQGPAHGKSRATRRKTGVKF